VEKNLWMQDESPVSSTICHCSHTYVNILRLVVQLVARLVMRSRLTYDCVRSIKQSIVAGQY